MQLLTSKPPVGAVRKIRLVSLVEVSVGIMVLLVVTATEVFVGFSVIGSPFGQTASGLYRQPL